MRPHPISYLVHAFGLMVLVVAAPLLASAEAGDSYSPYADVDYPTNLYWGDTHVHSSWSPDAGGAGNEKLTPIDAFRFAKGEPVVAHNGETIRLRRPLDFLLVSDHSEYLGLYPMLEEGYPPLLATKTGRDGRRCSRRGSVRASAASSRFRLLRGATSSATDPSYRSFGSRRSTTPSK